MSACIQNRYNNSYGVGGVRVSGLGMTMLEAMREGLIPYACTSAGGYTGACEAGYAQQNYDEPLVACPGSTSIVPQPAPVSGPAPVYTVPVYTYQTSLSPTPAPTVAANTSTPPIGTSSVTPAVASAAPAAASSISVAGIEAWFSQSTLIAGIPNMYIAGAAVLVGLLLLKKGKK